MSGRHGMVYAVSLYDVNTYVLNSMEDGRTGQNRTFPDIGVMQIADGGDDDEDRLKAEL